MTKYGIRNIEKNEEFLGSWTVGETRVSPAHEGDWSNSHVEWSSPISPQLKCSEHVLRFNIKCVCDTIILAGKSRWLGIAQDITHSDMDFHLKYTHTYLVPANQKQRHKYDTRLPLL